MDPRRGLPAAIAALAQPEGPGEQAIPLAVRLVIGLLLLFSTVAAWILFAKASGSEREPAPSRAALVLLACVPLITLLGMLVHVQRTFDAVARERVSQDLVHTLTVLGTLGIEESPAGARALSGFHAARIERGVVTASTLVGDAAALAAAASTSTLFYDCRSCGDWFRQVALRRTKDRPGVIHGSARTHSIGPDRSAAQTVDADQRYAGGLAAARRGKSDRTLEPNTMMKGHTSALAQYTSSSDPARRRRPSRQAATAARMGHSTRNAARLP